MQALILAGGEGTRLRPLTSTVPKPVVPLVDRPFIAFMLDWLRGHGVDDVIMSCGFLAAGVRNVLGDGSAYGVRLRYVEEPQPMGTGGALKFAESLLDERFLMLNGDVLTDLDVTAQLALHEQRGAQATLALTPVEDPSAYGLVRTRRRRGDRASSRSRRPTRSTRATSPPASTCSSARCSSCSSPTGRPRSSARSSRGWSATAYTPTSATGYWLDIGTPERYLEGTFDILEGTVATAVAERMGDGYLYVAVGVENAGRVIPSALVERDCRIAAGARIGGRAVLETRRDGRGRTPRSSARSCCAGARSARTARSAAASSPPACAIGDNTHIEGLAVLGEGVTIGAGNVVANGARVFPGVTIPDGGLLF